MNAESETPDNAPLVFIEREPIELYKILKLENWTGSGGEAKFAIAEGLVLVNNTVETRKRKKIFSGDTVEFDGRRIRIQVKPA